MANSTYTVMNYHGSVQKRGCSLSEAANIVMGYDDHVFEIQKMTNGKGYELWTSNFSRNLPAYNGLSRSRIFSLKADRAEAEAEIYRQVIRYAEWFFGCRVMTDDAYATMLAENAHRDHVAP